MGAVKARRWFALAIPSVMAAVALAWSPVSPASAPLPTGLGLSAAPYLGISCPTANSTACGRVGVSVSLQRPAVTVTASVKSHRVQLREGGLAGSGPTHWQGYVHLSKNQLALPASWYGTKPVRFLRLDLTIHYPTRTAKGFVRVQLHPGWG